MLLKSTSHYFVSLEPVKGQHCSELLVWHRNSIIAVSQGQNIANLSFKVISTTAVKLVHTVSLFLSEQVFQTGRALVGKIAYYVCSVHYMEKKFTSF